MPKSKIIKDVVDNKVPLDQSLTRLMILAKDVNNDKLALWAENELNGYKTIEQLPDYRKVRCDNFRYSGINGNFQVTNVSLPLSFVRDEILEEAVNLYIYDESYFNVC